MRVAPTRSARVFTVLAAAAGLATFCPATRSAAQTMSIEEYDPKSTLVVPEHHPAHAKFPFIDVHNHQDRDQSAADVAKLVADMDRLNMRVMVNLSGNQGAEFEKGYANLAGRYPGRFVVFANLDFAGIEQPGWGERAAAQLALDYKHGARGLKIFKNLGMTVTDASGKRVPVDDPRIDPVWDKCGELGIPVLIHTAEPRPFFEPQDVHNERWLELKQFPQRARPPEKFPPFEQLLTEQHHMFAKHPKTKYIDAHLGWLGGDLARLGQALRPSPQRLHGDRRRARGARPAAAFRATVVPQVRRPRDVRQGHVGGRRVPRLLPRARDRRRVLRLLPQAARVLEDVRLSAPGRRAQEDLLRERAQGDPGIDPSPFRGAAARP
jgi:predicted TIM-barrel fold metal-dependent hydrolase